MNSERTVMSSQPITGRVRRASQWRAAALLMLSLWVASPSLGQGSASQQEFLFAYKLMQRGDTAEAGAAFDGFLGRFPRDAQRGDALYFRAALYRQEGALKAAAELLAGVTGQATPKRVPMYAVRLLRGQVLTDLGQYDAAIKSLEKIDQALLPDNAVASVLLLRSLAYRGAGNFEASAKSAAAAAALPSPVKARAMLEQARAEALGGDAAAAIDTLVKALALDDRSVNAEAARYAGDLSYGRSELDQAVKFYTRVIERDQSSAEFAPAVTGRMWADLKAQRNVAVISAHKQFSGTLGPEASATSAYLAASAYQTIGQHASAAQLLTEIAKAGDAQPLSALVLYKLAVSQFELSRYDDMAATVERLTKRFPNSPQQIDASFLLATADAKQGRVQAGARRLLPFIEAGPESPYFSQALLRRGALYEQVGELDAAAADFKRYLDESGQPIAESSAVVLRYADVSHRLGRYAVAIEWCEALLNQNAPPAVQQEALYRLGEAQTRTQDFRAALASFDKLEKDHPIHPYRQAVRLRRGLLLGKLGRSDESLVVLVSAADDERLPAAQRVAALRIIAATLRDSGQADSAALALQRIEQLAGLESLQDHELLWRANHEVEAGSAAAALKTLGAFDGTSRKLAGVAESELLLTRGRASFMLGDLENAHRSFFGVVALGRGFDLEARLFLARTEAAQGNLDAALIELSDLVGAEDGRVRAEALYEAGKVHRRRAERFRRRGDDAAAGEALVAARASIKRMVLLYLTVQSLEPMQARGLVELSEVAQELGEPDAAAKELAELIRAFPDSFYAEYAKALQDQTQRRRPDDALARLKRLDGEALDAVLRKWVAKKMAELEALR